MRLLLSIIFFAVITSVNGQIVKFKAVKYICTRYQNQPLEPPEFRDLKGMAVEMDMDSSILYIHSPKLQVFHFDEKPIDGWEKDSVLTYKFRAVDKNGVKCILTHNIYESNSMPYFADVILQYPDKTYMYYLQRE